MVITTAMITFQRVVFFACAFGSCAVWGTCEDEIALAAPNATKFSALLRAELERRVILQKTTVRAIAEDVLGVDYNRLIKLSLGSAKPSMNMATRIITELEIPWAEARAALRAEHGVELPEKSEEAMGIISAGRPLRPLPRQSQTLSRRGLESGSQPEEPLKTKLLLGWTGLGFPHSQVDAELSGMLYVDGSGESSITVKAIETEGWLFAPPTRVGYRVLDTDGSVILEQMVPTTRLPVTVKSEWAVDPRRGISVIPIADSDALKSVIKIGD
jgi:hypothetical protein